MLAPPHPPESWRPHLGEILDPPLVYDDHLKESSLNGRQFHQEIGTWQ